MDHRHFKDHGPVPRLSYGIPEIARMLGVSYQTVRNAVTAGELRTGAIGTRRLASPEQIAEWCRAKGIQVDPSAFHQVA